MSNTYEGPDAPIPTAAIVEETLPRADPRVFAIIHKAESGHWMTFGSASKIATTTIGPCESRNHLLQVMSARFAELENNGTRSVFDEVRIALMISRALNELLQAVKVAMQRNDPADLRDLMRRIESLNVDTVNQLEAIALLLGGHSDAT